MAVNNPYAKYNNNKSSRHLRQNLHCSFTKGQLSSANIAMIGIEEQDVQKAHENISKAEAIIEELQSTLNYSYPVAQDFNNIYRYIYDLLVRANIHKSKEELEQALEELRGMRDTWKQVMKNAKSM